MTIDNTTGKRNRIINIALISLFIIAIALAAIFYVRTQSQGRTYDAQDPSTDFTEYAQERSNISTYNKEKVSFVDSDAPKLDAWIADGPIRRSLGLSVVDTLDEDQAMLFVFDESGVYPFWMRDMKFNIDIMWLNENKEVVFIKERALVEDYPDSYNPGVQAMYVLEVVEGFVEKYGIELGTQVDW